MAPSASRRGVRGGGSHDEPCGDKQKMSLDDPFDFGNGPQGGSLLLGRKGWQGWSGTDAPAPARLEEPEQEYQGPTFRSRRRRGQR